MLPFPRPQRPILHMITAMQWATRSTCKRCQCGAVITTGDMTRVLAIGYNGPGRKLPNNRCTGKEGGCGCLHAETNALLRSGEDEYKILFTTVCPCLTCAQLAIGANVKEVYYLQDYRTVEGLELLQQTLGGSVLKIRAEDVLTALKEQWSLWTSRLQDLTRLLEPGSSAGRT